MIRVFRDLGIKIVHEHAEGRLLNPALAASHRPAWRTHQARARFRQHGGGHARSSCSDSRRIDFQSVRSGWKPNLQANHAPSNSFDGRQTSAELLYLYET